MKVGLSFFPVRTKFLLPLAKRADQLGYDSLWLGEHMVFPSHIESKYPYNPEAGAPLPSTPLYDPFLTFTYIAAQTRQINFGTGIYVLPLRHPLIVAKSVATLDALSGGRVLFGIGSGWLKEEFDALGVPWEHRGARMEESVNIMRRLWAEPLVSHSGRFYQFEELGFEPKPAQDRVPVLVGGETPLAIKRAARCGDGWYGMHHTPESAARRIKELKELRDSSDSFEITVSYATLPSVDTLRRFAEVGVDRIVLGNKLMSGDAKSVDVALDGLERFAHEIMYKAVEN